MKLDITLLKLVPMTELDTLVATLVLTPETTLALMPLVLMVQLAKTHLKSHPRSLLISLKHADMV
jgi:hypothetical protein